MKLIASLLLSVLFATAPRPKLQAPIEATARTFLTNFAAGRFEDATRDFNDDLRPLVTRAVLADLKSQFEREAGVYLSVTEAHERKQDGFRAIELIARYSKVPVSVVVVFDAFDRIGAIYGNPIIPPQPDKALESAARGLLANFVAGHFEEAEKAFDDTMRAQLPPAGLVKLAASFTSTFGTYKAVTEVKQSQDKTFRIIDLRLACTKAPAAFRVAFDTQNRVSALQITPLPPQP
ncbi:MAG TPA: DUF3887 domain-containing protein [Thermoanaerobaculia bacterium]|nr:DUF3887 domain-containing protein [Thermoanaerobaculia bacterium]